MAGHSRRQSKQQQQPQQQQLVMVHVPFHGGRREMEREVNVMMEST